MRLLAECLTTFHGLFADVAERLGGLAPVPRGPDEHRPAGLLNSILPVLLPPLPHSLEEAFKELFLHRDFVTVIPTTNPEHKVKGFLK